MWTMCCAPSGSRCSSCNLGMLDDREKEVVVGRFGLDTGGEERTQREIAMELGISDAGEVKSLRNLDI